MRLEHIIQSVYFQPWDITLPGWRSIHAIVKPHLAGQPFPQPKDRDTTDYFGDPLPQLEISSGGIAIVPVKGTLVQHAGLLEKTCGACSYQDIKSDLKEASEMGVEKMLLDINSPGGMCVGSHETADYISELRDQGFQVDAFADTLMCSAAFDIACACGTLYLTRSAFAGSIGTMVAVIDNSKEFEEAGLKMELFTSGKFKGAGADGVPLTDDHRAYFNAMKDKFATMFKENVRAHRPQIADESMEGQALIGSDALDAGYVDMLVADIDEALELMAGD